MSEVISSFKSLRAGSQVFAILVFFLLVILYTIWLGKSLQLLCILPFDRLCLSVISMMFVKNHVGSVYIAGYGVFCKLCPVSFLVVGESPSVLL